MLIKEAGTASNIKSRQNRLSVQKAIGKAQNTLKTYTTIPDKGLVLFCSESNVIEVHPPEKLRVSYYRCDAKFHLSQLREMTEEHSKFVFIVINNGNALFAEVKHSDSSSSRKVLKKYNVMIDRDHRKGGQSAQRFDRRGMNQKQQFLCKVYELLVEYGGSGEYNGLLIAGPSTCKNKFKEFYEERNSKLNLDVIDTVTVSHTDERGLDEAILQSDESIKKSIHNKNDSILEKFFKKLILDENKVVYGKNCKKVLEDSMAKVLIISKKRKKLLKKILSVGVDKLKTDIYIVDYTSEKEISFYDTFQGIACILWYPCSYYTV